MSISVYFLGPIKIEVNKQSIPTSTTRKREALLAYLLVEHSQPHDRDHLGTMFFPGGKSSLSRENLKKALQRIKKSLSLTANDTLYDRSKENIQISKNASIYCDIDSFLSNCYGCKTHRPTPNIECPLCCAHIETAVNLYRGEFLENLILRVTEEQQKEDENIFSTWENWLRLKRTELNSIVIDAYLWLSKYHDFHNDFEASITYLSRCVDINSTDEKIWLNLFRTMAKTGNRGALLARYRELEALMLAEFRITPSIENQEIIAQIKGYEGPVAVRGIKNEAGNFINRIHELQEIGDFFFSNMRKLALVGPGGIGKTRLINYAVGQIRNDLLNPFRDGVFLISLQTDQEVTSTESLVLELAVSLNLSISGTQDQATYLLNFLSEKAVLLVVDNGEFLDNTSLSFLNEVAKKAKHAKLVVCARHTDELQFEKKIYVKGLRWRPNYIESDDHLSNQVYFPPAVTLLLEKAGYLDQSPDIARKAKRDLNSAIRICELVNGHPLAIELAASWSHLFSLPEIEYEIQRNLDLLEINQGDLNNRHRSIRLVFDNTWDFINQDERDALKALSVFQNSFTFKSGKAVANINRRILANLSNKSLIQVARYESLTRYSIHPLFRQFLQEKLTHIQLEKFQLRHAQFFAHYIEENGDYIKGQNLKSSLDKIEIEKGNIEAAWNWVVGQENYELAYKYIDGIANFYRIKGQPHSGRFVLQSAFHQLKNIKEIDGVARTLLINLSIYLAHYSILSTNMLETEEHIDIAFKLINRDVQSIELARLLGLRGEMFYLNGRYNKAVEYLRESVSIASSSQNQYEFGMAQLKLAMNALALGQYVEAEELLLRAFTLFQNMKFRYGLAHTHRFLGLFKFSKSDSIQHHEDREETLSVAEYHINENLKISREIGDLLGISTANTNLGQIFQEKGNIQKAIEYFEKGYQLAAELPYPFGMAFSACYLALIFKDLARFEVATKHLIIALETTIESGSTQLLMAVLASSAAFLTHQAWMKRESDLQLAFNLAKLAYHHSATHSEVRWRLEKQLEGMQVLPLIKADGEEKWQSNQVAWRYANEVLIRFKSAI